MDIELRRFQNGGSGQLQIMAAIVFDWAAGDRLLVAPSRRDHHGTGLPLPSVLKLCDWNAKKNASHLLFGYWNTKAPSW